MDETTILHDFIDEIAPKHDRTSCSDGDSNGNEYFNEMGYPRCVRCAFLHRLDNGMFPYGATFIVKTLHTPNGVSLRDERWENE